MWFPNDIGVDFEISMNQATTHPAHMAPRHFRMTIGEFRKSGDDPRRHFAKGHPAERSQGLCFFENPLANALRQVPRRPDIDTHAKRNLQFVPQSSEVEQRRARRRINQQIQIASLGIIAARKRSENPGIGRTRPRDQRADNRLLVG